MNAAIYARKSAEQNVSDDAKSVTRQLELGRAFAAEHGWSIVEEYADDGVSPASEFLNDLQNAAKAGHELASASRGE